jgi:hypothetical protein
MNQESKGQMIFKANKLLNRSMYLPRPEIWKNASCKLSGVDER